LRDGADIDDARAWLLPDEREEERGEEERCRHIHLKTETEGRRTKGVMIIDHHNGGEDE